MADPARNRGRLTVTSKRVVARQRSRAIAFNVVPLTGSVVAAVWGAHRGVGTFELVLLAALYVLGFIGVELGFHRYYSHRAFKCSKGMQWLLAVLGCSAGQGQVTYWASNHRRHHKYVDSVDDPHSPYYLAGREVGFWRGLWHAHIGWILEAEITDTRRFAPDLLQDPVVRAVNRHYVLCVVGGMVLPGLVGVAAYGNWTGAALGILWGGLVRMAVVQHATFAINSICHRFGSRPFGGRGRSTNSDWLALPTLGGAWHNNHHAFPTSAVNGLYWWQLDPGAWMLKLLAALGLVWDLRQPSAEAIRARRQTVPQRHSMPQEAGE